MRTSPENQKHNTHLIWIVYYSYKGFIFTYFTRKIYDWPCLYDAVYCFLYAWRVPMGTFLIFAAILHFPETLSAVFKINWQWVIFLVSTPVYYLNIYRCCDAGLFAGQPLYILYRVLRVPRTCRSCCRKIKSFRKSWIRYMRLLLAALHLNRRLLRDCVNSMSPYTLKPATPCRIVVIPNRFLIVFLLHGRVRWNFAISSELKWKFIMLIKVMKSCMWRVYVLEDELYWKSVNVRVIQMKTKWIYEAMESEPYIATRGSCFSWLSCGWNMWYKLGVAVS